MSESGPLKQVSKKKILFVQIDEEITSIFDRAEKWPYKDIYLMVPQGAVFFQSIMNLKILNQKITDLKKHLFLITDDPQGMSLAHQVEIPVFHHLDLRDEAATPEKPAQGQESLAPIPAAANDVEDQLPSRLPRKKSSIFEVVRRFREQSKGGFSLRSYLQDRKKNRLPKESSWHLPGGNKRFIVGFILCSLLVLGFIAYVALPGATLYLEPTANSETVLLNVTLSSDPDDINEIQAYPVEVTTDLTLSHPASDNLFEGENAYGYITIFNEYDEAYTLIATTRFQSPEGIIFRLQEDVVVPGASEEGPGQISAYVVADEEDANGTPIGDRGNIGPSDFILPALSEEERTQLYGRSEEAMEGGVTEVRTFVGEADFEAATLQMEEALKEAALEELQNQVEVQGQQENLNLVLLNEPTTFTYGEPDVELPLSLLGKEVKEFDLTGEITLTGIAYDQETLLGLLEDQAMETKHPGREIVEIDESSLTVELFNFDESTGEYTFTAKIWVVQQYILDPSQAEGAALINKITQHVAGLSVDEATAYIQSLPEINAVDIRMWPFWSGQLPTLPENIKVKPLSQGKEEELEELSPNE